MAFDMPLGKQLVDDADADDHLKGVAGVPRASLVVILATLKQFDIPEAGLLLIMGIDQFLDMGRSATNVIGNSLAPPWWRSGRANSRPSTRCGTDDAVPPDLMPGDSRRPARRHALAAPDPGPAGPSRC